MKKQMILLFFICLGLTTTTEAQKFYIRGGAGFGISATPEIFVYQNVERDPSSGDRIKQTTISGSFGSGPTFRLGGGYMITEYFGIDLEFYYLHGMKQDFGSTSQDGIYTRKTTGRTIQARMSPSLIVKAPAGTKFAPYAKFGVVLPFVGKQYLETEQEIQHTDPTYINYKKVVEIDGAFSVGFESAVGLQYNITEKFGVYLEMMYTGLRVKAAKGAITQEQFFNEDGSVKQDNLEGRPVGLSEFRFVDELSTDNSNMNSTAAAGEGISYKILPNPNGYDDSKPLDIPAQNSNYSAFGLNLGVKYGF
ncbi:MAG: porin family protein [Aureispira sp.]|nr:porin family protein [Aureispira sp.]